MMHIACIRFHSASLTSGIHNFSLQFLKCYNILHVSSDTQKDRETLIQKQLMLHDPFYFKA